MLGRVFGQGFDSPHLHHNKAPHYTRCGAFSMFTTLYMVYVRMAVISGSNFGSNFGANVLH